MEAPPGSLAGQLITAGGEVSPDSSLPPGSTTGADDYGHPWVTAQPRKVRGPAGGAEPGSGCRSAATGADPFPDSFRV